MSLISLPPELRKMIYDLSFPPEHTQVQLISYRVSLPACHLNLPLPLYRVCKLIHAELPPLAAKLRALDLLYTIDAPFIDPGDYEPSDDDPDLPRIQSFLRFAERLRLVGPDVRTYVPYWASRKRRYQRVPAWLTPGPECAVRVLEVQPRKWCLRVFARTMTVSLGQLKKHPDVAARLQVRLIWDGMEQIEQDERDWGVMQRWVKHYEAHGRGPILCL